MRRFCKVLAIAVIVLFLLLLLGSIKKIPQKISYGVSFSKLHSAELDLPWKKVLDSLFDDLKVKRFRFSAHWTEVEPERGKYNFEELDYAMSRAREKDASVVLAVGRRLPGWPECHEPEWYKKLDAAEKRSVLFEYLTSVVNRYKDSGTIAYWQVENEPYLRFFGQDACGAFDPALLREEIALVRRLDPSGKILITDSGEFGGWNGAYRAGDAFGSTMYLYVWSKKLGPIHYPLPAAFFRIRQNVSRLLFGNKPVLLAELGSEPWLIHPIREVSIEVQRERMGIEKFNDVLSFAAKSAFGEQYLWGAEWWYYMKEKGYPEYWNRAKKLFDN